MLLKMTTNKRFFFVVAGATLAAEIFQLGDAEFQTVLLVTNVLFNVCSSLHI